MTERAVDTDRVKSLILMRIILVWSNGCVWHFHSPVALMRVRALLTAGRWLTTGAFKTSDWAEKVVLSVSAFYSDFAVFVPAYPQYFRTVFCFSTDYWTPVFVSYWLPLVDETMTVKGFHLYFPILFYFIF